jgi:hypothetical protein
MNPEPMEPGRRDEYAELRDQLQRIEPQMQGSVGVPASAGFVFQAIVVLCVLLVEARTARRRA